MDVIKNNPYRCLGVYANTTLKDRLRNINRLTAFLKVGKQISFPLDLPDRLGKMERDTAMVDNAVQQLALPADQLKQAQFWFVKCSPLDEIAMNHLIAGNMDTAMSIWEKKDDVSSLQNRIVCTLIQSDYQKAIDYAEKLYGNDSAQFFQIVLGNAPTIAMPDLGRDFLNELCREAGVETVLQYVSDSAWIRYVKNLAVPPLIAQLQNAIDKAVAVRGKSPADRLNAGRQLMNGTKKPLEQLGKYLDKTDLQYQMIADKLGLEILQCGIDFYNGSKAADAAHKAMELQTYALSVVVGKMAKDRCQENVNILQEIISYLPPFEVFAENEAIREELQKFCRRPDKIVYAVTLLNNTKPHLQSIKNKLGATNAYYLKLSTQVVGNALHNIIEEVNDVQKDETVEVQGTQIPISLLLDRDAKINSIKSTLREAWKATLLMDKFDMELDFKTKRYSKNRSILKDLCEQFRVFTHDGPQLQHPSPPPSSPSIKIFSKIGGVNEFIKDFIGGFLGFGFTGGLIGCFIGAIISANVDNDNIYIVVIPIIIGSIVGGIIGGIHNIRH